MRRFIKYLLPALLLALCLSLAACGSGGDTDTDTEEDIVPVEAGTEDTLGDGRHQGCLRSCQGLGRIHAGTGKGTGKAIGLIEQVQDRSDGEGADD